MIKIEKEGKENKIDADDIEVVKCPLCSCEFSFSDVDIQVNTTKITYERGIKKVLGVAKKYVTRKYVSCPWCKSILKVKYTIE